METDELLKIARDKSVEGRKKLAKSVSSLFLDQNDQLSDRERFLMLDILQRLVHDFEKSVRKIVAEKLADWSELPQDLVTFLANDDIDVAYPILTNSGVLQDDNLIEIIRHRTIEHQMAIAIRKSVSEQVSTALVQEGHQQVITKLLENQNAQISEATMAFLVDEAQRVDSFREPILRRDDLDTKLAEKLFLWVSAALRQYITENFDLGVQKVDELLESAALAIFASTSDGTIKPKMSDELAKQIAEEGEMTSELLVSVLKDGEVNLFISLIKRATGLREHLIRRIIFEPGGEGLAVACKAIDIDKSAFSSIFAYSRHAVPESTKDFSHEIRTILKFFDSIDVETAKKVVHRWTLNPNYLAAIRDLEIGAA